MTCFKEWQVLLVDHDTYIFELKTEIYVTEADPTRFDVSDWMQRSSQYLFIMRNSPPFDEQCRWIISKGELRVRFKYSGNSGVMVLKKPPGQAIGVVIGIHNGNTGCGVTPDVGDMGIKGISSESWDGQFSHSSGGKMDTKSTKSTMRNHLIRRPEEKKTRELDSLTGANWVNGSVLKTTSQQ
ncbi:hypothetical protein F5B20DRAFT_583490 [Whalleya microplaca]|nr:hypothetical protein F5B20DRAFT_583490 [Whalleya microplaca]